MTSTELTIHVFPYRDYEFLERYGPIVRDLMIIKTLSEFNFVKKVIVYNRPSSLLEVLLRRRKISYPNKSKYFNDKVEFRSAFLPTIIGPLKGRVWFEDIYLNCYSAPFNDNKLGKHIVLDFLPNAQLPKWVDQLPIYWYDLIDNFVKHNRFTEKEKYSVSKKYELIASAANKTITGVSKRSIESFQQGTVLPNAILDDFKPELFNHSTTTDYEFDFGFIGFVTNKLDVNKIKLLVDSGFKVGIFGEFYDISIKEELESLKVYCHGSLVYQEVFDILKRFKVGLIPYKLELLHDESPLKLFQYFASNKYVLTSYGFEMKHKCLINYEETNFLELAQAILNLQAKKEDFEDLPLFWSDRLIPFLDGLKL